MHPEAADRVRRYLEAAARGLQDDRHHPRLVALGEDAPPAEGGAQHLDAERGADLLVADGGDQRDAADDAVDLVPHREEAVARGRGLELRDVAEQALILQEEGPRIAPELAFSRGLAARRVAARR